MRRKQGRVFNAICTAFLVMMPVMLLSCAGENRTNGSHEEINLNNIEILMPDNVTTTTWTVSYDYTPVAVTLPDDLDTYIDFLEGL